MPENSNNGTPKLLIETNSLFGDKRIEQVKVDSNRLDPIATAKQRMIEALIHPYMIDAYGDAICWISGTAFIASMARYTVLLDFFQVPLAILVIVIGCAAIYALTVQEVAGAVVLRAFYVLIGLALGERL